MKAPITDKHLLEMMWDRFPEIMKRGIEQPAQQEPVNLRRGDLLRCIETDELCTVWATSPTGNTLIKWSANNFGNYTAEQIGELFWLEPAQQCWKCGDMDSAFHAKCDVPACGMKEKP